MVLGCPPPAPVLTYPSFILVLNTLVNNMTTDVLELQRGLNNMVNEISFLVFKSSFTNIFDQNREGDVTIRSKPFCRMIPTCTCYFLSVTSTLHCLVYSLMLSITITVSGWETWNKPFLQTESYEKETYESGLEMKG